MFVVYGSSRENGNTEKLTDLLLEDITVETCYLRKHKLIPIVDQRHEANGFTSVDDDYDQIIKKMLDHKQIVLATPLYWYGMSSHLKTFVDRWSQSLRDTNLNFKEVMQQKTFYVVIVGGKDARKKALPLIMQFQLIFNFFGANFADYLIGEAVKPGEILLDHIALAQANNLNQLLR